MASPIRDYGFVGDGETGALISRDGSVDFLCWPRFDSDACFEAKLSGIRRRYRGDTLVLETTFDTVSGTVWLVDFMPLREHHSSLVRIVEGVRGEVPMRLHLRPRFGGHRRFLGELDRPLREALPPARGGKKITDRARMLLACGHDVWLLQSAPRYHFPEKEH